MKRIQVQSAQSMSILHIWWLYNSLRRSVKLSDMFCHTRAATAFHVLSQIYPKWSLWTTWTTRYDNHKIRSWNGPNNNCSTFSGRGTRRHVHSMNYSTLSRLLYGNWVTYYHQKFLSFFNCWYWLICPIPSLYVLDIFRSHLAFCCKMLEMMMLFTYFRSVAGRFYQWPSERRCGVLHEDKLTDFQLDSSEIRYWVLWRNRRDCGE